jgi:ABC-type transporter Mla subunit MlaD
MTQIEEIKEAIIHLEKAIDTFPDKDDEIREYNNKLDRIINELEDIIK